MSSIGTLARLITAPARLSLAIAEEIWHRLPIHGGNGDEPFRRSDDVPFPREEATAQPAEPAPSAMPPRRPAPRRRPASRGPAAAGAKRPATSRPKRPPPPPPVSPDVKVIDDTDEVVAEFGETGAAEDAGADVTVAEPWAGYDGLRAAEVVARLADADRELAASVSLYEHVRRSRATIVKAADRRLRALENAPG